MILTSLNPDQVNLTDYCNCVITQMCFLHPNAYETLCCGHFPPPDLPDIVVAGVLQGLYPRDVKVSFKKTCGKPSGLTCAPELPVHPKIPIITINRSNISSLPESHRIWAQSLQCCLATPSALNVPLHVYIDWIFHLWVCHISLCESHKNCL